MSDDKLAAVVDFGRTATMVMDDDCWKLLNNQLDHTESRCATMIGCWNGIGIYVNEYMPRDRILCLDSHGNVVGTIIVGNDESP